MAKTTRAADFIRESNGVSRTLTKTHGITVSFAGGGAYADVGHVNLPALPGSGVMTEEQVLQFRGYLDHEDAHHLYSELGLPAEIKDDDLRSMTNILEDIRIEQLKARDYPGSKKNMQGLFETTCKTFNEPLMQAAEQGDLKTALHLVGRQRIGYSGSAMQDLLDALPERSRKQAEAIVQRLLTEHADSSRSVLRLAEELVEQQRQEQQEQQQEQPSDENGESQGSDQGSGQDETESGEGSGSSETGDGSEASDESGGQGQDQSETGESEGEGEGEGQSEDGEASDGQGEGEQGEGQGGQEQEANASNDPEGSDAEGKANALGGVGGSLVEPPDIGELMTKGLEVASDEVAKTAPDDSLYFTPNAHLDLILHRSDRVKHREHEELFGDAAQWEAFKQRTVGRSSVIARRLHRMLASRDERIWQGGHQSGRLDRRRLVAAVTGKPNVFSQRSESPDLSTAVTLLVDLSGSMGVGRESKREIAADVTILMAQAIERLGASVEVLGFTTKPPSDRATKKEAMRVGMEMHTRLMNKVRVWPNRVYVFKAHEEPVNRCHDTLTGLYRAGMADNSDAEALIVAGNRLRRRTEHRKILLVMSDGMPAVGGVYQTRSESHLRRTIAELEASGIETAGLGICSHAVERFYPKYAVCFNLDEFVNTAFNEIAQVISHKNIRLDRKAV